MSNSHNKPIEMPQREIWANAVLKDGKLMFWWTGDRCDCVEDFYKDFYYAGLDMMKELDSGSYTLEKQLISSSGEAGFVEDVEFYKQFELHEDFKGMRPGESPFKPGDVLTCPDVKETEEAER